MDIIRQEKEHSDSVEATETAGISPSLSSFMYLP